MVAIDASFSPKSRRTSYGLDWFWNGSQGQAERGPEISLLALVDVTHNKAYTLSAPKPKPITPKETRITRIDIYLDHLDSLDAALAKLKPNAKLTQLQRM